jgi:hypothetical protein
MSKGKSVWVCGEKCNILQVMAHVVFFKVNEHDDKPV